MTAAGYWSWLLVLRLSSWCVTFGERCIISWLSVGFGTSSEIILFFKVMVFRGGCVSMVG